MNTAPTTTGSPAGTETQAVTVHGPNCIMMLLPYRRRVSIDESTLKESTMVLAKI